MVVTLRLRHKEIGEHHIAIPNHNPIKIGTLNGILARVAEHLGDDYPKERVLRELFE